jgi:uncharacterized protein (TIGR03083 family)
MEPDPRRWTAVLRTSHEKLSGVVKGLSPDQLKAPSYCRQWDVSQVLSHLGSGAEISLLSLERAVDGRPALAREDFPAIWARWDSMTPEQRAEEVLVWDRRHVAVLESLDDATLGRLHSTFFGMELRAADMVALRLGEHAVHTWDVAVSFDAATEVLDEAAALLVDRAPAVAGRAGKADALSSPRRVEVRTTGTPRRMVLAIEGAVTLTPLAEGGGGASGPGAPDTDGTVVLTPAALVRLVYGRLDPGHTPAEVATEGDITIDELRAVFPGF